MTSIFELKCLCLYVESDSTDKCSFKFTARPNRLRALGLSLLPLLALDLVYQCRISIFSQCCPGNQSVATWYTRCFATPKHHERRILLPQIAGKRIRDPISFHLVVVSELSAFSLRTFPQSSFDGGHNDLQIFGFVLRVC